MSATSPYRNLGQQLPPSQQSYEHMGAASVTGVEDNSLVIEHQHVQLNDVGIVAGNDLTSRMTAQWQAMRAAMVRRRFDIAVIVLLSLILLFVFITMCIAGNINRGLQPLFAVMKGPKWPVPPSRDFAETARALAEALDA